MTHEPRMTGTKECHGCHRELPVLSFAVNRMAADGLQSHCRDCRRVSAKENRAKRKATRKDKYRSFLTPDILLELC